MVRREGPSLEVIEKPKWYVALQLKGPRQKVRRTIFPITKSQANQRIQWIIDWAEGRGVEVEELFATRDELIERFSMGEPLADYFSWFIGPLGPRVD